MIEEYAIVTGVSDGYATLEIERRVACGLCGQKRGCGNATWGKLLGHSQHAFRAKNQIDASTGDSVVVGVDERAMLSSVFYLYIVPLLTMFAAAILADTFLSNEFYVVLAAMLGLLLGFIWVKGHLTGYGNATAPRSIRYEAVILRFADDASECGNGESANCKSADGVDKPDSHDVNVVKFQTKRGG